MKLQVVLTTLMAVVGAAVVSAQSVDPALLAKANAGDAAAQVSVGEQFAKGAALKADPDDAASAWKTAAEWYRKAADQGNISGEMHLAECYRDGRGVTRDMAQAAQWYRRAADQGDAAAEGTLGMLYVVGQGVPQSDADAYFWFDLAAAVPSPNQERYITNRQNVGTRITADELEAVRKREKQWKASHPRP